MQIRKFVNYDLDSAKQERIICIVIVEKRCPILQHILFVYSVFISISFKIVSRRPGRINAQADWAMA